MTLMENEKQEQPEIKAKKTFPKQHVHDDLLARLDRADECMKFLLTALSDVAGEQASRSYSGSSWLVRFRHALQCMERDMGFGEGPKTEKPT